MVLERKAPSAAGHETAVRQCVRAVGGSAGNLAARCGLLPFHAVGTDGGLLLYFRPDSVLRVDGTALDCVCAVGAVSIGQARTRDLSGCERESKNENSAVVKDDFTAVSSARCTLYRRSDVLPPPLSPEEEAAA